ncbi:MAG: ABC transporter substrate-binding protein [Candidatus Sulfotelmatobacter sp.]
MKHSGFHSLAASSFLLFTLFAHASTRPQYGGTLHVSIREAPTSLNPADIAQSDSFAQRNLTPLIFEPLLTSGDNGRLQASLATSWQAANGNLRWQFHLRNNVSFHGGVTLTPALAATSLRAANPSWKIVSDAESIIITCDVPCSHLPEELALSRNAIVNRSDDGKLNGTGPFHTVDWQPGKKLVLGAEEHYWGGRPFLDAIEIEFGKSYREQLVSLEMGKTDLIEVSAEQSHRTFLASHRSAISEPIELVALIFSRDAQSPEEKSLREALALSIERASMGSVILQNTSQSGASIVPNWMSGYAFAFSTEGDLPGARRLREETRAASPWTITYDPADPILTALAERVALNARDAGLQLQLTKSAVADLRMVRIVLPSDPAIALAAVAAEAKLTPPEILSDSAEDLYSAERELLATQKLIPLFHLPVVYAATTALKDWTTRRDGTWNLADAWLARELSGSNNP